MLIRIRRNKDLLLQFQSFECSSVFASNCCVYCTTRYNKCGRIGTKWLVFFFFTFIEECCVVIEKNIDKKLANRISYQIWYKGCLKGKFGRGVQICEGGSISAVTPGLIMLLFDMLRLFSKLVGNSSHLLYRHQMFFDIFVFRGSVPCEQGGPEAVFKLVINIFICRASPNVPLVCRTLETSDRLRNLVKLSPHGNHSLNTDLT